MLRFRNLIPILSPSGKQLAVERKNIIMFHPLLLKAPDLLVKILQFYNAENYLLKFNPKCMTFSCISLREFFTLKNVLLTFSTSVLWPSAFIVAFVSNWFHAYGNENSLDHIFRRFQLDTVSILIAVTTHLIMVHRHILASHLNYLVKYGGTEEDADCSNNSNDSIPKLWLTGNNA